jgi:hypothetical protein
LAFWSGLNHNPTVPIPFPEMPISQTGLNKLSFEPINILCTLQTIIKSKSRNKLSSMKRQYLDSGFKKISFSINLQPLKEYSPKIPDPNAHLVLTTARPLLNFSHSVQPFSHHLLPSPTLLSHPKPPLFPSGPYGKGYPRTP